MRTKLLKLKNCTKSLKYNELERNHCSFNRSHEIRLRKGGKRGGTKTHWLLCFVFSESCLTYVT